MEVAQQFIVSFLAMSATMQMGMSFFVALATYKLHTKVQRFNMYYVIVMLFWTYFTFYLYRITGSSHFVERFYVFLHVSIGINLVLIEAKSEKLKAYVAYSYYVFMAAWLIYISVNELVKTSPILAGFSYAYASILMLFLLYDKFLNFKGNLWKDPGVYITIGTYLFYAGTAIVFVLLQHYMVYWDYFPNARFYKPVLHISVNIVFYSLFIYSFLCNRSTSN